MLRGIRKKLFSYSTSSRTTNRKRSQSRKHKARSYYSDNDTSPSVEVGHHLTSHSAQLNKSHRTRSLSLPERKDKKRNEKELIKSTAVHEPTRQAIKSNHRLSRTSKRANSLPAKSKKAHRIAQAQNDTNVPKSIHKSDPLVEQLSTHKVATWLLDSEFNYLPEQASRHQQVPRLRPSSQTTASMRPTVNQTREKCPQQESRRAPLSSLSSLREVHLSGHNANFPLGQPTVSSRAGKHIPYWGELSQGIKTVWPGAESRPSVSPKNVPQQWRLTSQHDRIPHLRSTHLESIVKSRKELAKQMDLKLRNETQIRETRHVNATKAEIESDKKAKNLSNEREPDKRKNKSKDSRRKDDRDVQANLTIKSPSGNVLDQKNFKSSHIDSCSIQSNLTKRYILSKRTSTNEPSRNDQIQGGERVGWEYHTIALSRVPVYGFGIAVSGGRDNPHFMNGDPSIAISDVLKAGPAEGKLMVNDRVISANGVSLENVDYNQAISVLRECGNTVNLLIKRRALVSHTNGNINESNNNPIKVTLTKANKKDDFGIVLGCKIYIKEITNRAALAEKEVSLQEGDIIHKINNVDCITLKEAKKLLEGCKEKVSLVLSRESSSPPNILSNRFLNENGNYINGQNRSNIGSMNGYSQSHQRWPSNDQTNTANGKEEPNNGPNESNNNSAGIAAMANGRMGNGWNNQNLYVQPPTRAEYQQMNSQSSLVGMNESIEANDSNSTIGSRVRGPIMDISLSQLDQPATPLLNGHSRPNADSVESLSRPLPQRPNQIASPNSKLSPKKESELELVNKRNHLDEIRFISFHKEGSVGIRLTGGNDVGIFVTAVQPGSPASLQGLQIGDKMLKANGTDMKDFTREEAVLFLLRIQDKIELVVQNCKQEYEGIVANQKGDSFYIRVHFNYDSDGKGELSFHVGDIFRVVDTLFNGVVGSWFVLRLGRNNQEIQKGSIPNKSRADELAAEQKAENRSKKSFSGTDLNPNEGSSRRGNFFKRRRSARRSKSLSKEHWEDVVFGDCASKFSAYERVTLKHPGFIRPVVFFGPLADIAREKFLRDYPDKYASPQAMNLNEEETGKGSKLASSGIVRLSSIKEVIDKAKHALLDITPSAVDRLNYAQFYPIVIFMRAENKSIVKELRSRSSTKSTVHRSSRKLFEQSLKLEKLWHHIFTASVTLTSGGDLWYKKLRETIEKQQSNTIWMAESKLEENISDDFLFPMISRLSYASSPESDLDISANDSRLDDEAEEKDNLFGANNTVGNRLVKSSSDPSLAHADESPMAFSTEPTVPVAPTNSATQKDKQNVKTLVNSDSSIQRSPNKQLPLHILLRKELTKALHYDSKDKDYQQNKSVLSDDSKQKRLSSVVEDSTNYPTLRACDKYPREVYSPKKDESLPPPPSTLPPSSFTSKVQQQYVEAPPRIDRNSKPSRFRSAHERLFGTKSAHLSSSSVSNYHNEDSDYINTSSPVKYEDSVAKPAPNGHQRFVTGAFGDTSSYSSDSYNKYGSGSSTLENNGLSSRSVPVNEHYRHSRRSAQAISHSSSKQSSLERSKPLPPPPLLNGSKMEPPTSAISTFKAPPSPPPKPNSKYGQTLQYQMNSMTLSDTRPPPPPKPLSMPPPPPLNNLYDKQSDYDNMPAINANKRPMTFHGPIDISNGPPGYYQSLPQSTYGYHSKETLPRYSSTAETISNFINGTGNSNGNEHTFSSFSSLRRPSSNYMEMSADSMPYLNKTPTVSGASPSKMSYSSNYEHMRYNSISSTYPNPTSASSQNFSQASSLNNQGPYLNVPYSSKSFSQEPNLNHTYSMSTNHQSSPLPPPPPLPTYQQAHPNGNQMILQPTPQQPQSGQYLDLSLNRENRGSAFEVYRKPNMDGMHGPVLSDNQLFQGLPPPPPPLTVNDYNHVEYSNIDEINSSLFATDGIVSCGGGNTNAQSTVIASARGLFGSEGGSLVSAETGVSIIIPPGAISEGETQEIYFKVCKDQNLAPPLDKEKGETLLSPIVMCGPHGLKFNLPIELRLPHCAMVNPNSWSFALKSSDTNNGEPAGWRNITLNDNDDDGISGNNFNEQFVSVLVDHF